MHGIKCVKCKSTINAKETEYQLRERMTEHIRDVHLERERERDRDRETERERERDKPMSFHFGEGEHTQNDLSLWFLSSCMVLSVQRDNYEKEFGLLSWQQFGSISVTFSQKKTKVQE